MKQWHEYLSNLPNKHQRVLQNADDPAHDVFDLLLFEAPHVALRLENVNELLHSSSYDPWPGFLLAFASNGCGDYFAYDLRTEEPQVRYMDPNRSVWENLTAEDQLIFGSFSEWYELQVVSRSRGR